MKSFTDTAGRKWCLAVNVSAVRRCRALVDVDLYGLVGDGLNKLGDLLGDPCQLVDVLWVLTRGVPDNPDATDEEFGASLGGDALGAATDAFLAELTDFFPDPRVRAGLKAVIAKGRTVAGLLAEHMESQVDAIDPASEARRLIGSSGNSPVSSASTPAPSPSAN